MLIILYKFVFVQKIKYKYLLYMNFNCPPQYSKIFLLCLIQSSDTCDIQSLIGSVPSQHLQKLETFQIPDPNGSIIPATGQRLPIGTHFERADRPLMRF